MGLLGSFLGSDQAGAAKAAGQVQTESIAKALRFTKNQNKRAIRDIRPFNLEGAKSLEGLSSLATDPEAQREFIEQNPFFQSLTDRATDTLFKNAAARGKVGSGGTAEALQNSLVLLGNDLLTENIGNRLNIANLGLRGAQSEAGIRQNFARTVSDLQTGQGNAAAAGIVGAANARGAGASNLVSTGLGIGKLALSDERYKENAVKLGTLSNGVGVYRFNYVGSDTPQIGVMAQELEQVQPDAVTEIDGVRFVDYGAIH